MGRASRGCHTQCWSPSVYCPAENKLEKNEEAALLSWEAYLKENFLQGQQRQREEQKVQDLGSRWGWAALAGTPVIGPPGRWGRVSCSWPTAPLCSQERLDPAGGAGRKGRLCRRADLWLP